MLTAYTVRQAQLLDPHCDMLLVGDSLAQVIYGLPHTVGVTMEMMALHGAAVVRGTYHAAVRSEEHTSELQSLMRISYAVFCLKKKKTIPRTDILIQYL